MIEKSNDASAKSGRAFIPSSVLRRALRMGAASVGLIFYVLSMALIAMAAGAALVSVESKGWGADAAAWVQAAGSIAAIAGAAWLARSEARRERASRREQSEEAAWYVRFMIVQAQFESQIIAAELVNRTEPIAENGAREWLQRVATCQVGLNALMGRTDHVHPAVTHVTSNAKVLVDGLMEDLNSLAALIDGGAQPDRDLVDRIVAPHYALIELIKQYDARMRGVRLALDRGDGMLPVRAWDVWEADYAILDSAARP